MIVLLSCDLLESMNSTQRRLLGESVREIGVLTLVFVPLDMLLESRIQEPETYPQWLFWLRWMRLQHWIELVFAVLGLGLLYFGIRIEAKAELEKRRGLNKHALPAALVHSCLRRLGCDRSPWIPQEACLRSSLCGVGDSRPSTRAVRPDLQAASLKYFRAGNMLRCSSSLPQRRRISSDHVTQPCSLRPRKWRALSYGARPR
jgi:hypothetical protein